MKPLLVLVQSCVWERQLASLREQPRCEERWVVMLISSVFSHGNWNFADISVLLHELQK